MQTLRQYIDSHQPKRTDEQWAALLGCSRSHFTGVKNGTCLPGRRLIGAIRRLTNNQVWEPHWFDDDADAAPPERVGV